ncbi:MAG: thioredoxin domain-containing protein [Chitinophagaceae bacterium]
MKKACLLLALVITTCLAFAQKNKYQLSPDEFEKIITEPGNLLDVRSASEYRNGHIANSLQADWNNKLEFGERIQYLDRKEPVYVYCAVGGRSAAAAKLLRNSGFKHVYELTGGIMGWQTANKPVERSVAVKQYTMEDYNALLTGSDPILVDFSAVWCPPCKKMEPVLQELQKSHTHKLKIVTVDASVHTDIMKELQVTTIPTFIVYKQGKETWRGQGIQTKKDLEKAIAQ